MMSLTAEGAVTDARGRLPGRRVTRAYPAHPVARGRANKELAQTIGPPLDQVERLVTFRAGQSRFGRLLSVLSGKDRVREAHVQRGLVLGQQALGVRLDDMQRRGAALDVDVARIAGHLRTVQLEAADTRRAVRETAAGLAALADETALLADLVAACEHRLAELDTRADRHDAQLNRFAVIDGATRWRLGADERRARPAHHVPGESRCAGRFPATWPRSAGGWSNPASRTRRARHWSVSR